MPETAPATLGHLHSQLTRDHFQVVLVCGWGTAGSFGLFALAGPSVWILVASCCPLICCIIVLETICTAQLTKVAPGS